MIKKVLGKGLSALIPDSYNEKEETFSGEIAGAVSKTEQPKTGAQMLNLDLIRVNEDQPRQEFSNDALLELAASIKEKGIIQPLIVAKNGDRYQLICGERRFRAAKLCGLSEVPVVIKDIAKDEYLELALIENIQREDLNPIEEAEAYRRLAEERMLSQEEIAKRVGKDRSTVANSIRLLRLPEEVIQYITVGRLTNGHARCLLGLLTPEHQRQLAKRIVEENLSVRQVEAIVNRSNAQKRRAKNARNLKPEIVDLENRLERHLGSPVKIYPRKNQKQGRLEIQYFSLDDLDRILQKMNLPVA